ncbi:UNVERIFIED_CONTAM: hypothetical protein Sradi_3853900 [Sesamum radiatum]|uniref:Uncharacterized protein n=1 Tax=Sesamum radiatum TaxID=300843 RepID=A0AAW2Q1N1_SESRA
MDITLAIKAQLEELRDSFEDISRKEEILWKQWAKAHWLEAGDRNMNFFHAKANERRIRKDITKIVNEEGKVVSDKRGIQEVVLHYFCSIFASTNPIIETIEEVPESMEHRVTPAMNETLPQKFTSEQILHALKKMHPMKSLG